MGVNVPIVVYTHTDMVDTWDMFFTQLKKYLPNNKVYVAVNKGDTQLSDYIQIIYDDTKLYTDRWKEILHQIEEEVILFLHEDMVLFDEVKLDYVERYYNLVNSGKADSIKMIYTNSTNPTSDIDNTLIPSSFSIQPTLISKKSFVSLLESVPPLNIWKFEEAIQSNKNHYMVRLGNEKQRGEYHCDSIVFPYIATAINKGKWNMSEYSNELDKLFGEYNINPFERGIV
jgi:GTP:adenosylcobinamide-phosphate guanylyltransferase